MGKKQAVSIVIPPVQWSTIRLRIVGDSFLIPHAWSEKAKRMLRDKGAKKAQGPKGARTPEEDASYSLYWLDARGAPIPSEPDWKKHKFGFGIPCRAIKGAIVKAAADVQGVAMTTIKKAVRVLPIKPDGCVQLKTLDGKKLARPDRVREDLMRVGGKGPGTGTADLRYRCEFTEWSADVEIQFESLLLSAEQVVNLVNRAGALCGLLEDRPERTGGTGGLFHIETIRS